MLMEAWGGVKNYLRGILPRSLAQGMHCSCFSGMGKSLLVWNPGSLPLLFPWMARSGSMAFPPGLSRQGVPLQPEQERRRFQRLLVTLPVKYTAMNPESGETFQGEGVTRDFSLGGVYFYTFNPSPPRPGCLVRLTITTPLPLLHHLDSSHIQARARVLRLDEPPEGQRYYGLAVAFLESPTFLTRPGLSDKQAH